MCTSICTNGNKGSDDPEMTSEQLAATRESEQREAGKVLGLKDVVFLGYEDAMLQPSLELRRDISRQIRRHRPDVVITTNPVRSFHQGGTWATRTTWRRERQRCRRCFRRRGTG